MGQTGYLNGQPALLVVAAAAPCRGPEYWISVPTWDPFEKWTFLAPSNRRDSPVRIRKRFCRRIDMVGKLHRNKKNCPAKRILKQRLPFLSGTAKIFWFQFSSFVYGQQYLSLVDMFPGPRPHIPRIPADSAGIRSGFPGAHPWESLGFHGIFKTGSRRFKMGLAQ